MKFMMLLLIVASLSTTNTTMAQDNIHALRTDLIWYSDLVKFQAEVGTGVITRVTTTNSDLKDERNRTLFSAALAVNNKGVFFTLKYNSNNNGSVSVLAMNSAGKGAVVATLDLNGTSTKDLGFVRLGIDNNNVGWILASDDGLSPRLYLAKFNATGNTTSITIVSTDVKTSDNDNDVFLNGDLCFDGLGTMFTLANDGEGSTKMYLLNTTDIAAGKTVTLQKRWDLLSSNGSRFNGRVNGAAFASDGSMYISTDNGMYFIDQKTVNTLAQGTVVTTKKYTADDLTDLASQYWPINTSLPLKFTNIRVRRISQDDFLVTFDVHDAASVKQFNIQLSKDGKTYKSFAVVVPEQTSDKKSYSVNLKYSSK